MRAQNLKRVGGRNPSGYVLKKDERDGNAPQDLNVAVLTHPDALENFVNLMSRLGTLP